jgi:hypothetical protein
MIFDLFRQISFYKYIFSDSSYLEPLQSGYQKMVGRHAHLVMERAPLTKVCRMIPPIPESRVR